MLMRATILLVHSLLALVVEAHSSILSTHSSRLPPHLRPQHLPPPSPHERYTRAWSRESAVYRYAARVLVALERIQLLGEMLALRRERRRGTEGNRWRLLLGVEAIKWVFRPSISQ